MEIITGAERRRRWRTEEKLRIVAELEQPGASFVEVAQRHDLSRGLLWNWRHQVRCGTVGPKLPAVFLPVQLTSEPAPCEPRQHTDPAACRTDADAAGSGIEVTLTDGTAIRIGRDVSLVMLRRVMTALRR
jgi:transposase